MKFPRIFSRQRPESKESATGAAMVLNPGQAAWSNRNYAAFADEGYRRNVVAYQAINKIADAVASVKWTVWRDEQELIEHSLLDLLHNPNPMQSGPQYMRAKVGFLMIAGNGYEEAVEVRGQVRELYQLRPDRMKIVPGSNGFPREYVYKVSGREVRFPVDDDLSSPIRHLRMFNPLDDWYGMSPIEAGSYAIDQHNQSMTWMQALLQNSARPSGALVVKADKDLSDDQFTRLKAQMESEYQGAENGGRPLLLEGGLDWRQMGLSPTDMGIIEMKYSSARDVCLALGVPPQLIGIPGDNTYSNYAEARLAFWEDTVIPLLELIAEDWNAWLGEPEGVYLKPDLDQIPAIADKRNTLWEMADRATDLTLNERRAMKGYEPIPGGDVLLVGLGQVPLTDAAEPINAPDPVDVKAMARIAGYEEDR